MTSTGETTGVAIAPVAPALEGPGPGLTMNAPDGLVDKTHLQPSSSAPQPAFGQPARPALSARFLTEQPRVRQKRLGPPPSRPTYGAPSRGQATASDSDTSSESETDWDATAAAAPPRPVGRFRRHTSRLVPKTHGNTSSGAGNERKVGPYPGLSLGNDEFRARGRLSKRDGRVNISVHETKNTGYLAKALGATIGHHLGRDADAHEPNGARSREDRTTGAEALQETTASRSQGPSVAAVQGPLPKLNIVIMVIGSRGDIQPFLKIGKVLKERYGHRVRIATHPAFKDFVEKDTSLEFFSVGGDPAELMAFMVKNPGLVPSLDAVKAGEIGRKRDQMFQMFQGFWRACINAVDDERNADNLKMLGAHNPFVADAIIANPPCFAHVHCAERLGIPLHLMFTFPQTPTTAFPNPLANIKRTNVDPTYTNFMSYPLVEMITWQGLGDLVNRFRVKTLGLEPVSTLWAPGQLYRQKVPFTYLWSPSLVPKPSDWGPEVDIAGFVFLDLAASFNPPKSLVRFLEAGPPPIYIGFGSIVVDDPDRFTAIIFEAVAKAGVRALVSKGWGGLGGGDVPEGIYMLGNTPHDWIFPKVSAIIHHGGAGTSAIGLKLGKPTMIVPFFGDQPFWGSMIAKAGAGYHEPVPYKALTVEKLVDGIRECLLPEAQANAKKLAECIAAEGDGAENAVESFHRSLPLRGAHCMRCSILDDRVAVWNVKKTSLKLSALAASMLVEQRRTSWHHLRLLRVYEWNDFAGPGEPISGAGAAIIGSVSGIAKGIGAVPVKVVKSIRRHEQRQAGKRSKSPQSSAVESGEKKPLSNGNGHRHLDKANGQTNGNGPHKSNGLARSDNLSGNADDEEEEENVARDAAKEAGKSLQESGKVLVKAPMDLSLAIAQGFHNAPRLYGDTTVRRPTRIEGFHSGMRAAGEEFFYGIYDGVTGLVVQPYVGVRKDGAVGLFKGVGKGVGGFVLKDLAAIIGPIGYTLKGMHKELQKGKQPTRFIRRARTIQGQQEARDLSPEEKQKIIQALDRGWKVFQDFRKFVNKKKAQGVRGRLDYLQEKKKWQDYDAFENVEEAERVLEARKQGKGMDEVFKHRKEELEGTENPREGPIVDTQPFDQHMSEGA